MFLKKLFDLRRSLYFRLTVLYACIFAFTALLVIFSVYYKIQSIAIDGIDEELLEESAGYVESLNKDGLEAVKGRIANESQSENPLEDFYRLVTLQGEVIVSTDMSTWGPEDFFKIPDALLSGNNAHVLYTVTIPGSDRKARILSAVIGKGVALQIGEALDEAEEYLQVFVHWFIILWVIIVLISSLIGWFLARRALSDMKDVTRIAQDISEGEYDKRVQVNGEFVEIENLGRTFNHMLDRIQNLLKTMREVNDNIAHDLRSPLARIRGIAEMSLLKETTSEEYRAMAVNTIEECDHLISIVNTMLDITEIESGIVKNRNEEFDVVPLIRNACELFDPIAEGKGIRITTGLPGELLIRADRKKLQRIVSNLLDNAIKYTSEGGSICVSALPAEGGIKILFEDTGIGIPEAEIPHIFERFYRCDMSRSEQGVGLGLSLARALSESMNGIINVTSILNKGSRFTVFLPDALVQH